MVTGKLGLEAVALEAGPSFQTYWDTRVWLASRAALASAEGRQILARLTGDRRVDTLNGRMIRNGSGASIFEVERLAQWWLWYANEDGVAKADDALEKFLNEDEIDSILVVWLTGLKPDNSVDLADGIVLQPTASMQNSSDKEQFLREAMSFGTRVPAPYPSAAFTKTARVPKTSSAPTPNLSLHYERMVNLVRLLNCFSGIACSAFYLTSYAPTCVPLGPFGGGGGSLPLRDVWTSEVKSLEASEIQEKLLNLELAFEKFDSIRRERLQRALDRLGQAKARNDIADKALDTAIALEMLLLDDGDTNQQLKQSFRLRGAWLLGEDADQRAHLFAQFGRIYDLRSEVAHEGGLSKKTFKRFEVAGGIRMALEDNLALAERVVTALVMRGAPTWEKLILGAESA